MTENEVAAAALLAGRLGDGSGRARHRRHGEEDAQDIVDRDPYTSAGAARYERTSFNGAYRAQGL